MSLQICINCKELGMTWKIDSQDRTWWFCSECDFVIEEDESKECCCGKCNNFLPTVSWLIEGNNGFYWCFSCNSKTELVKPDTNDYEAWAKELSKMSL